MTKLLLILLMLLGAGCTQQREETGQAERDYDKDPIIINFPFDPTKHYITRIDTVGRILDSNLYVTDIRYDIRTGERIEIRYSQPIDWESWGGIDTVINRSKPCRLEWEYIIRPILDTSFAPKVPLLLTPEELKKIKKTLSGATP